MTEEQKKKKALFELLTKPKKKTLSQNSLLSPFWETLKLVGEAGVQSYRLGESKVKGNQLPFLRNPKFMSQEQLADRGNIISGAAKSTAGLGAYAVPFGKGSNFLTKALLPGAGVGLTSGIADERKSNPIMDLLAGGATAGAFRGATNTLGSAGRKLTQTAPKVLMGSVMKEAPKPSRQAVKKGTELYKVALEKGVRGNPESIYQQAIGKITRLEDQLQTKLKNSPATITIKKLKDTARPYIEELKDAGNETDANTVIKRIIALQKRHGAEVPIAKANEVKRTLYREIKESSYGKVATESKEGLKDVARGFKEGIASKIKGATEINKQLSEWGRIADAANNEIVKGTRGVSALDVTLGAGGGAAAPATGGLSLLPFLANIVRESPTAKTNLAVGLNKLGGIRKPNVVPSGALDQLLGQAGGRAGQLMGGQTASQPVQQPSSSLQGILGVAPQTTGQIAPQTGGQSVDEILGRQPVAENDPYNLKDGQTSPDGQWKYNASIDDWEANEGGAGNLPYTKEQLSLAIANATDKKTQDFLIDKRKALFPDESKNKIGATAAQRITFADSGGRGVKDALDIYIKNPDILRNQLLPGKFASRKFDSALFRAVENLLRAKTGAAAPEPEVRRYMGKFGPTYGDDYATAVYKLQQIYLDLEDVRSSSGEISPLEDVFKDYSSQNP